MKTYYSCSNNGVAALVSEETYRDIQKSNRIYSYFYNRDVMVQPYPKDFLAPVASAATQHLCVPIFTFTEQERFGRSPWFTGNQELFMSLARVLVGRGDRITSESFHVPFSNGLELNHHDIPLMKRELAYVTTEAQFKEAFGVNIIDFPAPACSA